jgi:hypothetical protein
MAVAALKLVGTADTSKMDPEFQLRLANLIAAAPPEFRDHLGLFSGYRDPGHQQRLFNQAVQKYGSEAAARKWVAKKSEHTAGFAADLAYNGNSLAKAPKNVVNWLIANAANYGLRFPLSNENWHIEPVEARASGTPRYDLKLASYPGLQPVNGLPIRMPPANVPNGSNAPIPMPGRPAALSAPKGSPLLASLPQTAPYGIQQRLGSSPQPMTPGLKYSDGNGVVSNDQLMALTHPFAQPFQSDSHPLSNAVPPRAPFVSEDHPLSNAVPKAPPLPIPRPTPPAMAPVPMPGRPPALSVPTAAQPVPVQPRSAPPPMPQAPVPLRPPTVTLASGKQIPVGTYNQGDHNVQVTDDGTGHAKIDIIRGPMAIPGVIDPLKEMNAPTLAGGFIRNKVPEVMAQGYSGIKDNLGSAVTGVQQTAANAVNGLGSNIAGLGTTIGSAFGGLFAPKPPAIPSWAPAGQFVFPQQRQQPVVAPRPVSRPFSFFRVAAPAPQQQRSAPAQQQAGPVVITAANNGNNPRFSNPAATYWDRSSGSWINN